MSLWEVWLSRGRLTKKFLYDGLTFIPSISHRLYKEHCLVPLMLHLGMWTRYSHGEKEIKPQLWKLNPIFLERIILAWFILGMISCPVCFFFFFFLKKCAEFFNFHLEPHQSLAEETLFLSRLDLKQSVKISESLIRATPLLSITLFSVFYFVVLGPLPALK